MAKNALPWPTGGLWRRAQRERMQPVWKLYLPERFCKALMYPPLVGDMRSILRQDTDDTAERSIRRIVRNPIARASTVLEGANAGQSADSQNQQLVRGFVLVDLGPAVSSLLENRDSESMATELLTESTSEPEEDRKGRARGILSKLALVGVVVGLGAILRTRLESGEQANTEAPDQAQAVADEAQVVADETAMRSGEAAERTESITYEAASMIQASGEIAAEKIQAGTTTVANSIRASGEETADQIQEVGETVEHVEEKAEESVSGTDNETDSETEE